ncbi:IPT/TIG domain-containing protein [Geodermatophilus obscurus]|uniref:IPT/TIG domain-containing protein n=1 Tax=Geodermatophilus obscurus TaxID=1861 RepID=A0A1I5HQS9_9ACTN|nr:IPT/TIG domain-containing protein [Geodermatophilus obscurus]SFO50171.1 IPT/TIG domain-containing protein [Geodermatophilus obscurus]
MTIELPLQGAHLTGGLERVSWWNGRILTAEDMTDHQRAVDEADRRLGRTGGAGVVDGLFVSRRPDGRSVDVTAGLAVDETGETLALGTDVTVHLVPPPGPAARTPPADFVACRTVPQAATVAGTGVYLLTIASAAGSRGAAPGSAATGVGASACGPRFDVAGVQFRLVEIDIGGLAEAGGHGKGDLGVLASLRSRRRDPRLRNVIAHVLLDTLVRARSLLAPFGPPGRYTPALQRLADGGTLAACEVPLAVVVWAGDRADFVDTWAARRTPSTAPGAWPSAFIGARGSDGGLPVLLQFADHLGALVGPGVPPAGRLTREARQHFRYLPPAVLLPLVERSGQQGVDPSVFLTGLRVRDGGSMVAGRVWPLLTASLTAPVVDLDADVVLHSYTVEEAVDAGAGQPYLVLAADHLRHLATPPVEDGRPVITGVSPPGDHEIGSRITVHGRNFAVPDSHNTVTVGGARVRRFHAGTPGTALVFDVPSMPRVPRTASIVVSNEGGTADTPISVIAPVVVPQGALEIAEDLADLAGKQLDPGETVTAHWLVTALTDVPGVYTFSPLVSGSSNVPDRVWLETAAVVDDAGNEKDTFELAPATAGSGEAVRIGIRITIPVGTEQADLALRCTLVANPADPLLNRTSSLVLLTVSGKMQASDPRTTFGVPFLVGGSGGVADDGALVMAPGDRGQMLIAERFDAAATVTYTASITPATPGFWVLEQPTPGPSQEIAVEAGSPGLFGVTVRSLREDPSPSRTLRVQVSADPGGGAEGYVSFVRLRLRNS